MTKSAISTTKAPAAIGPYAQAIVAANLVFVSGQIAIDPATGSLIEGSISDQTHRIMKNLSAIAEAADLSLEAVVKTTIYLKNMSDFKAVNEVYGSYFSAPPPARATIEVSALPLDAAVEIEAILVKA
ncbi:MAG: RidA family protein [Desulfobulbaceae bacterium]|nr:MAG: RidA family protein [Desulfobulbaceae bacterium]